MASAGPPGGDHRRDLLHPSRTDHHPGPVGPLPGRSSAALGPRAWPPGPVPPYRPWPSTPPSGLLPASWHRAGTGRAVKVRWIAYLVAGGVSAATIGAFLVLVLIVCGGVEIAIRTRGKGQPVGTAHPVSPSCPPVVTGGMAALCWVAFKVGALSYGGGFVIIPLMQHDAVVTYHWMTGAQFLNAVALGQVTPGPVVQTVAVVGYAASGLWGGVLAAAMAFAPSFVFVIAGAGHFDRLRADPRVQAFFVGAGSAVIGAIAGSAIPLGLELAHLWQLGVLALAAFWLLARRGGVFLPCRSGSHRPGCRPRGCAKLNIAPLG